MFAQVFLDDVLLSVDESPPMGKGLAKEILFEGCRKNTDIKVNEWFRVYIAGLYSENN